MSSSCITWKEKQGRGYFYATSYNCHISGIGRCFSIGGLQGHALWFKRVHVRNHLDKLSPNNIMGGSNPLPPSPLTLPMRLHMTKVSAFCHSHEYNLRKISLGMRKMFYNWSNIFVQSFSAKIIANFIILTANNIMSII